MDEKRNKVKELHELVDFLKANGIAEFDMERTDLKVRINKLAGAGVTSATDLALAQQLIASGGGGRHSQPARAGARTRLTRSRAPEEKLHEVKSPIVGTFYERSAPGVAPFVKVGDWLRSARCSASWRP